ncbi:NrdH-redoxin [Candidatus Uhrbacteria bacterium RIFOXYB12_FULL_58_10]|uniref:NrdH-redoxin n=1 Tax=Candidatus Uhrbacteria bacterium RIFOXYB2_FULL_57_15 TaxID=1802422 RepID=A0A1F7WAA6_9BACT|nr:MAG: NrdH-redoxin [Candidatus Uhrbacteria bacterium RIFOXYB12_FULL_58_10]OGL99318.1 MAG: NrdH-redoxin [Candidatus Uhrbacteria bacterium RIFOXYB2_FULL_57_15]OGM00529.1 MAG: NrdH-redoxin [Candidatus Uhrbacteria bacterium RIFOXYC12_FULL_57_11]
MNVTVYSTPTCPYCKLAKKFLTAHDVAFEDIDVAADSAKAREMIEKTKQMGVPVIEVDDELIIGFDEKKLKKALGIK